MENFKKDNIVDLTEEDNQLNTRTTRRTSTRLRQNNQATSNANTNSNFSSAQKDIEEDIVMGEIEPKYDENIGSLFSNKEISQERAETEKNKFN